MSNIQMPWGKYKGRRICDVPGSYLFWVLEECGKLDGFLEREIREDLSWRLPQDNPVSVQAVDRQAVLDWCKKASLACHPDHGGSVKAMKLVNELRSMLS